jgi:MarR family transcriptional regulator, organic hydroperoxide resistance regulator
MMGFMNSWNCLFDLLMTQRARVPAIAAEFELSPVQAYVLRLIEPGEPVPMGRLARGLACDASNVTGIVDRLEARGLVERRAAVGDRRVKVLVITREGEQLRATMLQRMAEPPAEIQRLSPEDQRTLARILQQMSAEPA